MADRKTRLSVIIVSANSAKWLRPCLTTVYERAGNVDLDVVVVAAGCTDETVPLVERHFPQARTISCPNRGFAFANNRALRTVDADWVLFLNPDTEILEGSFADLIDTLGPRSTVGLAGVRQVTADGQLFPTIRHFPNAIRFLFETLGSERFPIRTSWLGERELDLRVYERDIACDWTSGSFMLVRWEALQSAGFMDERFFLFCEETDLCLRIKQAGWEIRHVPTSRSCITRTRAAGILSSRRRWRTPSVSTSRSTCLPSIKSLRKVRSFSVLRAPPWAGVDRDAREVPGRRWLRCLVYALRPSASHLKCLLPTNQVLSRRGSPETRQPAELEPNSMEAGRAQQGFSWPLRPR